MLPKNIMNYQFSGKIKNNKTVFFYKSCETIFKIKK